MENLLSTSVNQNFENKKRAQMKAQKVPILLWDLQSTKEFKIKTKF